MYTLTHKVQKGKKKQLVSCTYYQMLKQHNCTSKKCFHILYYPLGFITFTLFLTIFCKSFFFICIFGIERSKKGSFFFSVFQFSLSQKTLYTLKLVSEIVYKVAHNARTERKKKLSSGEQERNKTNHSRLMYSKFLVSLLFFFWR